MGKRIRISFVLDETGSMQTVKGQTISGFNEYVKTLRAEKNAGDIRFTLTKFSSARVRVVHDGVKLDKVELLTGDSYNPANLTPLYDAIGRTIRSIEGKTKKTNVLIVIQTDGQENASKEFTRDGIFSLISEKKKAGWTFVFLGADQDAWAAGYALGLDKGNVMSYASADTGKAFQRAAAGTVSYTQRGGGQTSDFFAEDE